MQRVFRTVLLALGALSVSTGVFIFFAPRTFYESIPGLDLMGPFSVHFIRDVGLAFLASGFALIWGGWKRNRTAATCGAVWPSMHALFHVQIWGARGFPLDEIFFFDLVTVMTTAALALWAALQLRAGNEGELPTAAER